MSPLVVLDLQAKSGDTDGETAQAVDFSSIDKPISTTQKNTYIAPSTTSTASSSSSSAGTTKADHTTASAVSHISENNVASTAISTSISLGPSSEGGGGSATTMTLIGVGLALLVVLCLFIALYFNTKPKKGREGSGLLSKRRDRSDSDNSDDEKSLGGVLTLLAARPFRQYRNELTFLICFSSTRLAQFEARDPARDADGSSRRPVRATRMATSRGVKISWQGSQQAVEEKGEEDEGQHYEILGLKIGGDYATEGLIYACPGDVSSEAQWTSRKIKFDNGLGGETFSVFKETTGAGCSASFEMQGTEGWLTGCSFTGMKNGTYTIQITNGGGNLQINDWWWSNDNRFNHPSPSQPTIAAPTFSSSPSSASSLISSASGPSLSTPSSASTSSSASAEEAVQSKGTQLALMLTVVLILVAMVAAVVICCVCTRTRKKGDLVVHVARDDDDRGRDEEEKSLGVGYSELSKTRERERIRGRKDSSEEST
ncbi:hypothetical protein JCM11641_007103 [Rhodosporidiobolus odoratus]